MKFFFSVIATLTTFGFSSNAFSELSKCTFTVFYWAKYGNEDDVRKSVKDNCKFGYTSCETLNDGFITINSKKMSITHQLNDITSEQCNEKALQACRYAKDESVKDRTVQVWFSNKPLSAYVCHPGNRFTVVVAPEKVPLQESTLPSTPKPEFKKVRTTN